MTKPKKLKTPTPQIKDAPSALPKPIRARPDLDIEVVRYNNTRFYAVYVAGDLLAVTVYKKGALAIEAALLRRC